ncbi:energy-coupling factor transporter transmembrane protein EcfT [Shewanella xiamenensis]|uniref:Cobalt ABC transporter permease n=2 Tax=Shewanella TaxID=22 RepID=A0A220UT03_9GAMM|nr:MULTISPECIES: energy-coupling factor transporter transmembrane component T [Shewanella]ASK71076.1 cobalt ABC transporter permease [Shewanella bicestrii]MCL1120953.1 energy-coupling factor transporter transmembrane protein EcfT [Shewanella seohaensis]MDH1314711.1 energy-coupling factor transporter transmembrane protein EcfT [Shewanella xiamenensis]PWF61946.1 cobalt ABC transporter permease [Shewanella sp. BC20]UXM82597.1 energy-coupling factor transporter transmembrane protein EcfT [Shewanel
MWVSCRRWRLRARRRWSREKQETTLCALSLFLVCVLSACAFVLPADLLLPLAAVNGLLVLHGLARRGSIMGVVKLGVIQLTITLSLYLLLYGVDHLAQGAVVVGRIILATIPGWWLCITAAPERIGEVLSAFLPSKWAFVVAASLSLLPYMADEVREIYQIQCLRGARITPKALRNPKNWPELVYCVLFPVLIQLLKLSRQMAVAAQSRHFGKSSRATHWHSPRDKK